MPTFDRPVRITLWPVMKEDRPAVQQAGGGSQHLAVDRVRHPDDELPTMFARRDGLGCLQPQQAVGVGHAGDLGGVAGLGEGDVAHGLEVIGREVGESGADEVDEPGRAGGELCDHLEQG